MGNRIRAEKLAEVIEAIFYGVDLDDIVITNPSGKGYVIYLPGPDTVFNPFTAEDIKALREEMAKHGHQIPEPVAVDFDDEMDGVYWPKVYVTGMDSD